jgi:hypothetical protein
MRDDDAQMDHDMTHFEIAQVGDEDFEARSRHARCIG